MFECCSFASTLPSRAKRRADGWPTSAVFSSFTATSPSTAAVTAMSEPHGTRATVADFAIGVHAPVRRPASGFFAGKQRRLAEEIALDEVLQLRQAGAHAIGRCRWPSCAEFSSGLASGLRGPAHRRERRRSRARCGRRGVVIIAASRRASRQAQMQEQPRLLRSPAARCAPRCPRAPRCRRRKNRRTLEVRHTGEPRVGRFELAQRLAQFFQLACRPPLRPGL